jgi:RNA polymerase sigma-70 factor (ECF subfamily)
VDAPTFATTRLHDWLARARAGDAAAPDEMLRACWGRLERLARAMLGRFPAVRRWADTGDVLQNALLRLLQSLKKVDVPSTRDYFGLAAEQMRRELLELAQHFHGPHGYGARHAAPLGPDPDGRAAPEPGDPAGLPGELDRWCASHEAVGRLPAAEREVVGLTFYHGWTQAEIAELFGVDEQTIRRRWRAACLRLNDELGDLPPL